MTQFEESIWYSIFFFFFLTVILSGSKLWIRSFSALDCDCTTDLVNPSRIPLMSVVLPVCSRTDRLFLSKASKKYYKYCIFTVTNDQSVNHTTLESHDAVSGSFQSPQEHFLEGMFVGKLFEAHCLPNSTAIWSLILY